MITSKVISTDEDFKLFAKHYQQASGNNTPLSHFKRVSTVRAFKNKQGDMLGGYTINSHQPIRYFDDIPLDNNGHFVLSQQDNVVETGGLWVNPEVSNFYRGIIYLRSLYDLVKSKKRFIISGAKHPKVAKLQSLIFPNKVYEGPIKNADYACILYATRRYIPVQALLIVNKYWVIEPIKQRLKRNPQR